MRFDVRATGAARPKFAWFAGFVKNAEENSIDIWFDNGIKHSTQASDSNVLYCGGNFHPWPACRARCAHHGAAVDSELRLCETCVELFDARFVSEPPARATATAATVECTAGHRNPASAQFCQHDDAAAAVGAGAGWVELADAAQATQGLKARWSVMFAALRGFLEANAGPSFRSVFSSDIF